MKSLNAAALTLAIVISPVALTKTASAHTFEERATNQAGLIEQGRQSGAITWREGLRLRKEQREIAKVKESFEADGRLSRKERRTLWKLQKSAADHISEEANDGYARAWWAPRFGR